MLARLSEFLLPRRRAVLLVAVLLALAAGAAGSAVFDRLKTGGFDDPGSESGRAATELVERFGRDDLNLALLVHAPEGVDDPAAQAAGTALSERLAAEDGISDVTSYWLTGAAQLRSGDGESALILAAIAGDDNEATRRLNDLQPSYEGEHQGLTVEIGGAAMVNKELGEISERDAVRGEMIAFPVMLVVLVLIFGSLVAAALPLVIGVLTILLSFGLLWLMATVSDISILALNVVTLLGLGLAVDYSLLMVNRYREELAAGRATGPAVRATMASAGRTVLFSAVTVAVTLACLAFFPLLALRSIAYAGIAVALLSALVTLTVLPALLALLGPRVDRGRLPLLHRASSPTHDEELANGFWHRLSSFVMRRPVPIATLVAAGLLLLGAPFLNITLGTADERVLPESSSARQVAETLRADYDSGESQALNVVLPQAPDTSGELTDYATTLSELPGVARVDTSTGTYAQGSQVAPPDERHAAFAADDGVYLAVVPHPLPTPEAEALVDAIRALPAPAEALVGGQTAVNLDGVDAITDNLPAAGLTLLVTMYVLLFLLTGSVLLPLLAMLLSAIGLTATFGALVWGFQDGHLSGLLDFTTTGDVAGTVPVMLFAVAFGLGMDYQVFLLSRIREEYDLTGDPTSAVALGLERIGRIVTAAAATLSIVFLAFLVSDIVFLKALGIGLPLAVLMDATLIRGALLPATMRLGGAALWGLPTWLRPIHDRFGLREAPSAATPSTTEHAHAGR
ncbi:MMPL family transporter [Streptomyces millisiae]|uniref:MMPL family transporter n=1 Tax=Streptomyces millisiae TaxID=3075542 RepID=A0ABU2LKT1_9ACTN|nr:MMPL family transporter [Streptomyces sp. DSM 44918]MDT0318191.1 MMPL family transporter [Streptomyces sp. DSM 44918]